MRSSNLRHVMHLRLRIVDSHPPVEREIVVDRDLSLGDLRHVVREVLGAPTCTHHLFTDAVDSPGWSPSRRRWGDRWTMIDFRDPTVIDEMTASIGSVMRGARPIYFAHTCDSSWVAEIEPGRDDIVPASDPWVRVVGGEGRTPFACSRGPLEHHVLVSMLEGALLPDHDVLRSHIEFAVGPWATFDPRNFDAMTAQHALDARLADASATGPRFAPLETLSRNLPSLARASLRKHIADSGLDLPVVVTVDEAAGLTREFRWLIDRTSGGGGVRYVNGQVDAAVVSEGAEALGCQEDRVRRLFALAKQLRVVYSRKGFLIAKKTVSAVAASPIALWTLLGDSTLTFGRGASTAGQVVMLAIADGSLGDPAVGLTTAAHVFTLISNRRRDMWGYQRAANDDFDCDQGCDCPELGGATWHDVVAKAIREAGRAGLIDGARAVAAHEDPYEAGMRPEWIAYGIEQDLLELPSPGVAAILANAESELLSESADLVELLSLFGLARSDDGAWIVPPMLREFVRATLQRRGSRPVWDGYGSRIPVGAHPF